MKFLLIIAVFTFVPCNVQGDCRRPECKIPIQHYKELGCVPFYSKCNDSCPLYFNCPNLGNRCSDKCYYRGKVYDADEPVDEANKSGNCLAACFCAKDDIANIVCAVYDCAPPPELECPDCYLAAEHTTCCPQQAICPPFDNIANCSVNGKIYYEGQRFTSPTNENLNCICKPGFKGKYVAPFCIPVNCGIEIYNSESIRNLCAPIFSENSGCPINWQCEKGSEIIETSRGKSPTNMKCSYGKKKFNIGDKMTIKSSETYYTDIKCECSIPPLLTCFQSYIGN